MKIDWKRKLTSRKFWVALLGFLTPLLLAFGLTEEQTTRVAGLITSGASVITYVLGEGLIDAVSTDRDGGEEEE